MNTSPYVCCPGCLALADDFQRATLGCQWSQRSGSWSISSDRLVESGNDDAVIIAQRAVSDMSFRVVASIPNVPSGAIYRAIVNYVDDDNYHFAEIDFTSGALTIRLCKRSGGSNSTLKERSWDGSMVGSPQSVGVCFTEKIFSAGQEYEPYMLWITDPTPHDGGYRAGLGNGANVEIEFDDFWLSEHLDTNADCAYCVCRCDNVPLPMTLTAHVTFKNSLEDCEPVEVTLEAIRSTANPEPDWEQGQWYGTATVDCSNCTDPIDPFELQITFRCDPNCDEDPGGPYWLRVQDNDALAGDSALCCNVAALTCDPLSIKFDVVGWIEGGYCSAQSGDAADLEIEITT